MEQLNLSVLRRLLQWHQQGQKTLLATVLRTWGSSPRPIGSIMALNENAAVVGSVSGGCIEDDLIERYCTQMPAKVPAKLLAEHPMLSASPVRVRYGMNADDAYRFGLPCGGTLELLLEFNPDAALLGDLAALVEAGQLVTRSTHIATGRVQLTSSPSPQNLRSDGQWLHNTMGPAYRMLLIGAGPLAEFLATMAQACGFRVCVCDPRQGDRGSWAMHDVHLDKGMPDDVVRAFGVDRRTAVIALSHDPKLDDCALLEALASQAFYIGVIGSQRNQMARRARMMEHFGHTAQSLARLRGPVGLPIGSHTPSEIAVSIMAEVLAVKNNVAQFGSRQACAAGDAPRDGLNIAANHCAQPACGVSHP